MPITPETAGQLIRCLLQNTNEATERAREMVAEMRSDDVAALEDAARLLEWVTADVLMQRPMNSPLHGDPR